MIRIIFLFSIVLMVSSCAGFAQRKGRESDEQVKDYKEDYSSFRPRYEIVEEKKQPTETKTELVLPKNDINKFLAEKLDSVYFYNNNICCADGYRVLIYVGSSSEEASSYRNNAYDILPLEKSYKDWRPPSFKVKVGDYIDKLEAYYAYAKLVKIFPSAIVIPDKVNIVRE
jgi:hypothetical protein